ncbi:MAG: glycerophosphodiester phosphodiesterase [Candidatus Eremiobacteraeota bacterium]|nr:glycerophosphodiester phosphodiesterase [Candidatus Eremiobacteraeota bacterium]MCW5870832.1 glycerophosphodiester phosphodiesterase [Candidatus Eremiobacteraeota bacterium]
MKRFLLLAALSLSAWAKPIVIAHRGASGYLPEHTLEGYELAVRQGADYIEPDLVPTKDGHLVARHENDISETTDVASRPEFARRKTTKTVDGRSITGWFTEDFTLAELKRLRARGRNRASRAYDGRFQIATFEEVLRAVRGWEKQYQRTIGVYPETKHPSYFRRLGHPIEEPMLAILSRFGYHGAEAPVFIQSFEVGNLQRLKQLTEIPLVQLVDEAGAPQDWVEAGRKETYADMVRPAGLAEVAAYAQAVSPYKLMLIRRHADGSLGANTGLIEAAHAAGLKVHSWTFRAENQFLPPALRTNDDPEANGHLSQEVRAYFEAGLDGVFSNMPDQAVTARDHL